MSSKPPIVPSKNALRALRRLALQGSTVIGAVGGLCGVAAISYDARQRVKFAERIVNTKRTIRSVSNGNGATHIQRMFEAAERGEDFGLDPAKASQRKKRRNSSAVALDIFGAVADRSPGSTEGLEKGERTRTTSGEGQGSRETTSSAASNTGSFSIAAPTIGEEVVNQKTALSGPQTDYLAAYGVFQDRRLRRSLHESSSKHRTDGSILNGQEIHHQSIDHRTRGENPPISGRSTSRPFNLQRGMTSISESETIGKVERRKRLSDRVTSGSTEIRAHEHGLASSASADLHSSQGESRKPYEPESSLHSHAQRPRNSAAAANIIAATQQPHKLSTDMVYGRPNRPKKSSKLVDSETPWLDRKASQAPSPAEKIIEATQQQHKLGSHTVYARPSASRVSSDPGLAESVSLWLRPHKGNRNQTQVRQMSSKTQRSRSQPSERRQTPTSGSRGSKSDSLSRFPLDTGWRSYSLRLDTEAAGDQQSAMHSAAPASDDSEVPMQRKPAHSNEKTLDILDSSFSSWPVYSQQLAEEHPGSTGDQIERDPFEIPKADHNANPNHKAPTLAASDKFHKVCQDIRSLYAVQDAQSYAEARQLWHEALAAYATPGRTYDLQMLHSMYTEFHETFFPHVAFGPLRLLARHLLANNLQYAKAAALLFPVRPVTRKAAGLTTLQPRDAFKTAILYLADIWREDQDVDGILAHFQTVLNAAQFCEVKPREELFAPVLRMLCSVNCMSQAQALYDRMVSSHSIDPSFYSRSVMVRGYAASGDWDRVANDMEAMHAAGLSRQRPHGYSLLFTGVYRECVIQKPLSQAYDYLVHAIGYWGLVPTSAISTTVIQACLADRRYDLVREWVETVRTLFPQVGVAISSDFAWQTAETWKHINASCEDIERACSALAYRSTGEAFTNGFKEVVQDSLAADLARKLHGADVLRAGGRFADRQDFDDRKDLDGYLQQSFTLLSSPEIDTGVNGSLPRGVKRQLSSASRLQDLLNSGDTQMSPQRTRGADLDQHQERYTFEPPVPSKYAGTYSTFPEPLVGEILPSYQEIETLVFRYYASRAKEGLPLDNAVLRYVCEKLRRRHRQADVVRLFNEVYSEPRTWNPQQQHASSPDLAREAITVDVALLSIWLRSAFEIKSLVQLRKVLWATLKETSDIRLTRSFVLLARMSVLKMTNNRYYDASEKERTELEWLFSRLKQRYWDQRGKAGNMNWREKAKSNGNPEYDKLHWEEMDATEEDDQDNVRLMAAVG